MYELDGLKYELIRMPLETSKLAASFGDRWSGDLRGAVEVAVADLPLYTLRGNTKLVGGVVVKIPPENELSDGASFVGLFVHRSGLVRGVTMMSSVVENKVSIERTIAEIANDSEWSMLEMHDFRALDKTFGIVDPDFGIASAGLFNASMNELGAKANDLTAAEKKMIIDFFNEEINGHLTALRQFMPVEAFKVFQASEKIGPSEFNFYAHRSAGEVRRQAAAAYPPLATVFPKEFSYRRPIDNQESLNTVLSERMGTTAGKLKRLQQISYAPKHLRMDQLIQNVLDMDGSWAPKTEEEWDAYCEVAATYHLISNATGTSFLDLCKGFPGSWTEYNKTLRKAAGLDMDAIENDVTVIGDGALINYAAQAVGMSTDLTDKVIYPMVWCAAWGGEAPKSDLMQERAMARLSATLLFGGLNGKAIMEKTARYDHHRAGLMAAGGMSVRNVEDLRTRWPAITGPVRSDNGWSVVPYTQLSELQDESRHFGHCVGYNGYDRRCYLAESAIFSIRDENGERQATLEVDIGGGHRGHFKQASRFSGFAESQIQGMHGSIPGPEALIVSKWFIRRLNTGEIASDLQPIKDHAKAVRFENNQQGTDYRCGYDALDLKTMSEVHIAWREGFTKKFKGMGISALAASPEFTQALEKVNPYADMAYNLKRVEKLRAPEASRPAVAEETEEHEAAVGM